ncbi:MAG TPA: conjugative transposon protein TraN [Chitinophagaceae bacterium]|nr:conjugative transposon protein TraN [Chitinophagaceae bacterium]
MKRINITTITVVMLILTSISLYGQGTGVPPVTLIRPYHLGIACLKTTNLVFPYAIKSVDRGSEAIMAQKAAGVNNVLQIKAAKRDFEPTNLTVITGDGHLYSFLLHYAGNPARLNLVFGRAGVGADSGLHSRNRPVLFNAGDYNQAEIEETALIVAGKTRTVYGVKEKSDGMKLALTGLFIGDGVMYYQIVLEDRSAIDYDIGGFRFLILDEHRYKRTASQETEIRPLYIQNDTCTIKSESGRCVVFALPKQTLPERKYLLIRLQEKNGGRDLALKVHSHRLMKAQQVLR